MPNNNGKHRWNGDSCPHCLDGRLRKENNDSMCLYCGYRQSFINCRARKAYLAEVVTARLIHHDNRAMDDIDGKMCKKAGMAAKAPAGRSVT